ncbi:DUF1835 domain-containing protein [Neobacillus pocheonensis]|uniref:DUF1835 domain-containing protein n=1 Tax=Neobacillus pocheonensis TaxID=363869 RepID=A0ABT0W9R3_9BACI|nr:DUF1835 domain-containing protein [Neobacillus pocheonensis]
MDQTTCPFFDEKVGIPASLFIKTSGEQSRFLDEIPRETEIVLWFEHDRYDQTMLMYLLNELSRKEFKNLSMVTINEYPGIEPFYGLGQLSSQQLEELFYHKKQSISKEKMNEAILAWKAYISTNPTDIEKWIATSKERVPFLKQALQSHLSYFPSVKTGLNEVETFVLEYMYDYTCPFTELFHVVSKLRISDGLSDLHFAAILNELMNGPYPLLESDRPLPNYQSPEPHAKLKLTFFGLEVLKEQRDFFEKEKSDWWVGGVNLKNNKWYWDGKRLINP